MTDGPAGLADLVDFDRFALAIGELLQVPNSGWSPGDPLAQRTGWDYLTVVEVLVWAESLGAVIPDEVVASLETLGDLHHYLVTIGTRDEADRSSELPPFTGRLVRLVPMTAEHVPAITEIHTTGDHLTRYRLRGVTPSPEAFHQMLWDRALVQMTVLIRRQVVGLVTALQADLRNRHAHLAVVVSPDAPLGAGAEAASLLIDHLFNEFDLRKLYAEVLEPNLATFGSGVGRIFTVEGRLAGHEFHLGAYQDVIIVALTRERWAEVRHLMLGRSRRP